MEQTTNRRRDWRKLVKKLQRKRRRQKFAQQRDKNLEEAELEKLKDPLYKTKMEQQEQLEQQQQREEASERQLQEELWLRRELLAQEQFKRDELKRQEEEAKLIAELIKKEEELKRQEEVRRKKREELNLRAEREAKEFEDLMLCMQQYLEDSSMKTPERLDRCMETKSGEKPCEFFLKTNSCRFGSVCSFNHKRPLLAKTLLIRHFFQHPLLEQQKHEEYSRSDSELELSERDLRDAYDEFCGDVWPVLEEFGTIVNFRAVRNVQSHFRGNVFVEYADKRSALKAFMNLHNRYYASKRLNVEFSNIRAWRTGVCGLSLGRKCPKGVECNFFHFMKNKDNKYNKHILNREIKTPRVTPVSTRRQETPLISSSGWSTVDSRKSQKIYSRNWRWSESPEIELKSKTELHTTHGHSSSSKGNHSSHKNSRSKSPNSYSSHKKSRSKSPDSHYNKNSKRSAAVSTKSNREEKSPKSRSRSPYYERRKTERKKARNKSPDSRHKRHKSKSPAEKYKTKSKRYN
ncbi:hypothetical protein FF38_14302 [Lucilia cuprina]|uniref:Uncharacterized protein n=1 Tax=Lucilia cuprina TaxID=7375 RepID=A0A0L0CGI0_LUCCU|nr:hypothetical protein FF38_14302 [Lucilia cuprina]